MTHEPDTHYVYRCYDAEDRLLYVGCTSDLDSRFAVHGSSWNNPVSAALNLRMVRHTEVEYPTKVAARQAERDAIYDEAPLLNLHHQRERVSVAERRARIDEYLAATAPKPNPATAALLTEVSALFTRERAGAA